VRNTVTRLKPRAADYGTALSAFLSGDYLRCVEHLDSHTTLPSIALRARSFLRMSRFSDTVDVMRNLAFADLPHGYAGELLAIKASALLNLGDSRMESVLTEARARAFSSGFRPVECEVEFLGAQASWTLGRSEETLGGIDRLLELSESIPSAYASDRDDYVLSMAYWRSRAYELRGMIEALHGDFASQAASIARAFKEFDRGHVDDVYFEARLLSNLAVLVRDVESEILVAYVEDRADQVSWSGHTTAAEFSVFQAIGWNKAKKGDHLGAFRQMRRSANCAPTVPLQIMAILDRSFLARELGEVLTASEDLEHAAKLAKQVDWENADGAEKMALYVLARQLAPFDTRQARSLWERYNSLKATAALMSLSARGDRRQRADECSAHAAILISEGQLGRGISLLLESFDIWTEVGYVWRAAAVAVDLAELTCEARYFEVAAREAAKQPNSWLARRVAAIKASSNAGR
jgi:tetratricopeptide (TPR) repeat protein